MNAQDLDLGRAQPDTAAIAGREVCLVHQWNLGDLPSSLPANTVVDATLIAAPSSTKNKDHARDPEMHSSKKGEQMYFGMKAPIGEIE